MNQTSRPGVQHGFASFLLSDVYKLVNWPDKTDRIPARRCSKLIKKVDQFGVLLATCSNLIQLRNLNTVDNTVRSLNSLICYKSLAVANCSEIDTHHCGSYNWYLQVITSLRFNILRRASTEKLLVKFQCRLSSADFPIKRPPSQLDVKLVNLWRR